MTAQRSGAPQTASVRLAELLVGLSLAADAGMGLEPGESARATVLAARLAEELAAPDASDAYYVTLLQHVGCTAYAHEAAAMLGGDEIAVKAAAVRTDFGRPRDVLVEYLANLAPGAPLPVRLRAIGTAVAHSRRITAGYTTANCEVAALTAHRVGLGRGVERGLAAAFERVDGKGAPHGLRGDAVPAAARIAQVALLGALFDRMGGPELAVATVRARAGAALDADVAARFCARAGELLGELDAGDPVAAALAAEPAPRFELAGAHVDEVCRAFGEAVDLKSPLHHGHSTGVAALAEAAAGWLGMPDGERVVLRRAGLLHDLGRAAVPNGVWEKPGPLTTAEWERVRLHAYHSERILAAAPPLAAVAQLAGLHHERLDGSGYHRELAGPALPMPVRVLAAADVFQAVTEPRAHRPARDAEAAGAVLAEEAARGRLDADAVAGVRAAAGQAVRRRRPRTAGLTDRQLQVLRLVAQGLSNREIATRLVVSPRTAERHVQDIYDRIGVASRAGAALFAMQHDLLAGKDW